MIRKLRIRLVVGLLCTILGVLSSVVMVSPASAQNLATGDTDYFCQRNNGTTTVWRENIIDRCDGFIRMYRDGTYLGRINVPRMIAEQGKMLSRNTANRAKVNAWCSSHSFDCAVAVGLAFYIASLILPR